MSEQALRLGIVGCGAVTEQRHLPAAQIAKELRVVALADKDIARARRLGRRYGISLCTDDYRQITQGVDAMILAIPNYLHASVAGELLEMGIPLLVEKPLTTTVAEAKVLIEKARAARIPLQVGHMYRFSKGAQLVKRLIDEDWLGPLRGFSLAFGAMFSWPIASGYPWRRDQAGGGVLIDLGPHTLDLLVWWLGDVAHVEYWDDSLGGVEADCRLSLSLKNARGVVHGDVALSRLRNLGTSARIVGERLTIEFGFTSWLGVRIRPSAWENSDPSFVSDFGPSMGDTFSRMYADQLRAFARAIREGSEPVVSGESVLGTVALIERCYRERKPLPLPWLRPPA